MKITVKELCPELLQKGMILINLGTVMYIEEYINAVIVRIDENKKTYSFSKKEKLFIQQ